jgi:transmembrane 9 superfamily protein 3
MYFVFTSFWAYKIYYVYGFMLLVVVMLWIVTACVAIVGVYFLLNAEDYRWYCHFYGMPSSLLQALGCV